MESKLVNQRILDLTDKIILGPLHFKAKLIIQADETESLKLVFALESFDAVDNVFYINEAEHIEAIFSSRQVMKLLSGLRINSDDFYVVGKKGGNK